MRAIDVLLKARETFDKEGTWIKNSYAKNAEGFTIEPNLPEACQFCAMGAIYNAAGVDSVVDDNKTVQKVKEYFETANGITWGIENQNDGTFNSQADAVGAFDVAIAYAKKKNKKKIS